MTAILIAFGSDRPVPDASRCVPWWNPNVNFFTPRPNFPAKRAGGQDNISQVNITMVPLLSIYYAGVENRRY